MSMPLLIRRGLAVEVVAGDAIQAFVPEQLAAGGAQLLLASAALVGCHPPRDANFKKSTCSNLVQPSEQIGQAAQVRLAELGHSREHIGSHAFAVEQHFFHPRAIAALRRPDVSGGGNPGIVSQILLARLKERIPLCRNAAEIVAHMAGDAVEGRERHGHARCCRRAARALPPAPPESPSSACRSDWNSGLLPASWPGSPAPDSGPPARPPAAGAGSLANLWHAAQLNCWKYFLPRRPPAPVAAETVAAGASVVPSR